MVKKFFYAVARGRTTGIFDTWEKCQAQVQGFAGNKYKGFATRSEAAEYLVQERQQQCKTTMEESDFTPPPHKKQCTERQQQQQGVAVTELANANDDEAIYPTVTDSPSSSEAMSSEKSTDQAQQKIQASPPEVATIAVKSLHESLQEKFEKAQATGQVIALLSPPQGPAAPDTESQEYPEVATLAVKSPSELLQEKFDQAQATGKMIDLFSPDRKPPHSHGDDDQSTLCDDDDDDDLSANDVKPISQSVSQTKTFPLGDMSKQMTMDDVKMKMNFDQAQDTIKDSLLPSNRSGGPIKKTGDKNSRITDVLSVNLSTKIKDADEKDKTNSKAIRCMEGDIPQLGLHKKFFVGGVRVGWPYPIILPPQRQMVMHVINALKRSLHVVLESPTGTGKSAALLCSVLAWQRYHAKVSEQAPPKIFYCSRTHSQVAQMVASLKKTPYRPRMSVLGSREHLCIHREIRPRDGSSPAPFVNANLACRIRVKNTEKYRKKKLTQQENGQDDEIVYNDDNPPMELPSDGPRNPNAENENENRLTCPHYRQLTTTRTATMAQEELAPSQTMVSCCSVGGEKTKLGATDIEDLVAFGKNPYVRTTVVYRDDSSKSFGITLGVEKGTNRCNIQQLESGGPASKEGTLVAGDRILKVNGRHTRDLPLEQVVDAYNMSRDPLELQVLRRTGALLTDGHDDYSQHSACPYYLSRALTKHAEIVFAPYNYLLDRSIREAMGIDLSDSVVVLDEAHNVEDTLRESGSGKFGELELSELAILLEHLSRAGSGSSRINRDEEVDRGLVAHELLIFVERILKFMRQERIKFETNPGKSGAKEAILEWQKFRLPDDREFEIEYFGPTGTGIGRKAVGCKPFFDRIRGEGFVENETLLRYAKDFENSRNGDDGSEVERRENTLCDRLVELVSKLCLAMTSPQHFYVSCAARANGSLAFASGEDDVEGEKKQPKKISKSQSVPLCQYPNCATSKVVHCHLCDGSEPKWEAVLSIQLLTPSILLKPIANECRSLIFASGSLAPLGSLCAELGLSPASDQAHAMKPASLPTIPVVPQEPNQDCCKLQVKPPPLEADHVIDTDKQLRAISIGSFTDGSTLTTNYANYSKEGFYAKLGNSIATVVEAVPSGGVLVFLPSYSFLRNCIKSWKPTRRYRFGGENDNYVWDRFGASKRTIVVEPTGSQAEFEAAKEDYRQGIRRDGKALLLAVFRGKMSEGISFNDDFARAVICVGIPFPNSRDRSIMSKKAYNDEMRKLCGKTSLLPGTEWYTQQAYRAIAQALGRCIRHRGDYGTVILMDSRHCDDGAPVEGGVCRSHRNLPKWMRSHVRNLSMGQERPVLNNSNPPIFNGYRGLAQELKSFFAEAKRHSEVVMENCRNDFEQAKARDTGVKHAFDHKSGTWT